MGVDRIRLKNINHLCKKFEDYNETLRVKVRSTGKLLKAKVKVINEVAEVSLEKKEMGISPGQACVFYSTNSIGDKVLGGGWIDNSC